MIADKRVQFLNTSFFVICLFALFVFFGLVTRTHQRSWSEMLTYLFALRYAVSSLRQVTGIFIKFSKFLPEYRTYSQFVDHARRLSADRAAHRRDGRPLQGSLTIKLDGDRRWDSHAQIQFDRSTVLWVLTPDRATHFELEAIASRLGRLARPAIDLASQGAFLSRASLDAHQRVLTSALGNSPSTDLVSAFRAAVGRLGVIEQLDGLSHGLDTVAEDLEKEGLSPEAMYAIGFGHVLAQPPEVAIFAVDSLTSLDRSFVDRLLDEFKSGYVVLVDHRADAVIHPTFAAVVERVTGIVVMEGSDLIAGGDQQWFQANFKRVKRYLQSRRAVLVDEEDDLEEDDDSDSME